MPRLYLYWNLKKLITALKKALAIKSDSVDFMVLSAEFYRDQGNKEEAIKYYEQAIKLSPQNQALKDEYNKFKSGN